MATATQLILETVVKGTEAARAQIQSLNTAVKNFSDSAVAAGKALTVGVTVPIVGIGTNMLKIAADVAESQSKFDAVFTDMAAQSRKTFEQMGDDVGRSSLKLQDMGASLGALAKGYGATSAEAADLGAAGVQAAIDLASFNNVADAEALNAYRSALAGETEPMKRFGIDVSQAGLAVEAQRIGLNKAVKDLTQFEKATLVASKVAYQMGAQGSLGDAARTSESFSNRMKTLTDKIYELQASFGEIIKNAVAPFLGYAIKLIDAFQGLDEPTKTMIVRFAAIAAAVGPALLIIGTIGTSLQKALNPMNLVIAAIGALVAYFGNLYLTNSEFRDSVNETFSKVADFVVTAFNTIKDVISKTVKFIQGVWDVIGEPVMVAFTAIKDVVVGAITFIAKEVGDWIKILKNLFAGLWNVFGPFIVGFVKNFKDNFTTIVDFVKNVANILFTPLKIAFDVIYGVFKAFFQVISGDWQGGWDTIKGTVVKVWESIKSFFKSILTAIGDAIYIAFNSIGNFIKGIWPTAKQDVISGFTAVYNAIKNIGDSIVTFFGNLAKDAFNWGVNLIQSMVDGILSMPGKVADAAAGVAKSIKDFLGFGSPTEKGPGASVMSWMPNLTNTLAKGLKDGKGVVGGAAEGLAGLIKNVFGKTAASAKGAAKQITSAVAAIPADVLQLAGPMFDKINEKYNDFFTRASEMPEKLKTPFESMYNAFRDSSDKIQESMSKLTENFKNNIDTIKDKISEAREDIKKLGESYTESQAGDNQSLAERVVEQEQLVAELRSQVSEKKNAINTADIDANQDTLNKELADLESKLNLEQRALEEFRDSDINIQKQISEARKRSRQSDFENYLEDYQAKSEQRLNDYNEEVAASEAKIALYERQQNEMENTYEASMDKIGDLQKIAQKIYEKAINQQVLATEAGTNLMKQYFDSVTDSVMNLSDALGSVSDKPTRSDATVNSDGSYAADPYSSVPAMGEFDYSPQYVPAIVAPPGGDTYNTYIDTAYGSKEFVNMIGQEFARNVTRNSFI